MGRYISITEVLTPAKACRLNVVGSCCCLWTVPAGVTTATFEVWGGGGGAGAKCCCRCEMSSPGFGGGYALKTITVSAGSQYTICAGPGGAQLYCAPGGTSYGCAGGTSYVTGGGLSNLCAVGGSGGCWIGCTTSGCYCMGGTAYGGDVCIYGGTGSYVAQWEGFCQMNMAGHAPLGGGLTGKQNDHCCRGGTAGCWGSFPGGGGASGTGCCCDCCWCNGGGGSGLVRVHF